MTEPHHIVGQNDRIADAYQKWYGALFGYICKRIGWDRAEDAEDLVQETFLHLLSCKSPLAGDRLVRFIYKVAKNQVIDYLRHHACIDAARIYFQEHARRDSCLTGYDDARKVRNVRFEGLKIDGRVISDDMPGKPGWYATSDFVPMYVGPHVEGVQFVK